MNHDAFRRAWDSALGSAGLLAHHDIAEESLALGRMSRHYRVLLGAFQGQPAEPFTGSMELRWRWDALLSARTSTTEEDALTELLGREDATNVETERPWLRVDIKLHGKLPCGKPLLLAGPKSWRAWVASVAKRVDPLVLRMEDKPGREGVIDSWLGEPEAQVRCTPSGELWLLGVELAAWQAIELPRQRSDFDRTPDEGPEEQLEALAERLSAALVAWKESLKLLLPHTSVSLH